MQEETQTCENCSQSKRGQLRNGVDLSPMPSPETYIHIREAAVFIGYTAVYTSKFVRDGKLQGVYWRHAWYIEKASAERFKKEHPNPRKSTSHKSRKEIEQEREYFLDEGYVSLYRAAILLGIEPHKLDYQYRQGNVNGKRVGGQIMVKIEEVQEELKKGSKKKK